VAVDAGRFRSVMRRWASGVSIVTTRCGPGIQAITVSSFCSLSLDPPLVVICIDHKARSHALLRSERRFAVNILRADQRPLADRAAGREGEEGNRLEGVPHATAATGAPVLEDCLAWLDCVVVAEHEGGDHTLFVGRVEAAGHADGSPLLWFNGAYCGLAAPPAPRRRAAARRKRP
jgi:flavin reductase (DIM6/NTAB) family NADH-FMN oxidoreductase RutF